MTTRRQALRTAALAAAAASIDVRRAFAQEAAPGLPPRRPPAGERPGWGGRGFPAG